MAQHNNIQPVNRTAMLDTIVDRLHVRYKASAMPMRQTKVTFESMFTDSIKGVTFYGGSFIRIKFGQRDNQLALACVVGKNISNPSDNVTVIYNLKPDVHPHNQLDRLYKFVVSQYDSHVNRPVRG